MVRREPIATDTPHGIRMEVKRLLSIARLDFPEFDFVGEVNEEDVAIEALIHPETFEIQIRVRGKRKAT